MRVAGGCVCYADEEKLVQEGTEGIIQAEKVHSEKTEWQAHGHSRGTNHGLFHDSNIKLKGAVGTGMVSENNDRVLK